MTKSSHQYEKLWLINSDHMHRLPALKVPALLGAVRAGSIHNFPHEDFYHAYPSHEHGVAVLRSLHMNICDVTTEAM